MNERIRLTNSFDNSFIRLTIPIRLTNSNSFNELSAVLSVFFAQSFGYFQSFGWPNEGSGSDSRPLLDVPVGPLALLRCPMFGKLRSVPTNNVGELCCQHRNEHFQKNILFQWSAMMGNALFQKWIFSMVRREIEKNKNSQIKTLENVWRLQLLLYNSIIVCGDRPSLPSGHFRWCDRKYEIGNKHERRMESSQLQDYE